MPNVIEKVIAAVTKDKPATDNSKDPIPTGATNLTITSGFVAALALVVDQFTGWSEKLLGANPSSGSRAALAIAIIGATAVIFAADLLARGYASAHTTTQSAVDTPAAPVDTAATTTTADTVCIPALASADEHGWRIIRAQADKVLVVKKGHAPKWYPIDEVRGE